MNGRPLDLSWEDQHVDGILEAWYLGTMAGHGMADVISGDYNPSARLTMSFPRTVGQLPLYYNQKPTGRPVPPEAPDTDYKSRYMDVPNTPLYPFGYGLSYTTFDYKNAKLSKDKIASNESVTLSFDIANTGKMDGDEVAQIYIKNPNDPAGPLKAMKAFKRVNVKAGSAQPVSIQLEPKAFQSFNDNTQTMEVRPGKYQILYGGSSDDKTLKKIDLVIE